MSPFLLVHSTPKFVYQDEVGMDQLQIHNREVFTNPLKMAAHKPNLPSTPSE